MDVLFWLRSGRSWILPLHQIDILHQPSVAPAPGSPLWLLGACPHNGRAIPVIDLSRLTMATPPSPVKAAALVELPSGPLAFAMDEWRTARIPQAPTSRDWQGLVPNISGLFVFPERLVPHLTTLLMP